MTGRIALLALLPFSTVFAFSNTVPFVVWSSESSDSVLSNLTPGTRPNHAALLQDIVSNSDVCSYDAVVVVDHPGLHSSDLRTLQPSSQLAALIKNSPSSRQLPHVEPSLESPVAPAAVLIADRCGSIAVDVSLGSGAWNLEADRKHVLSISLPPIEGSPRYRKTVMAEHEQLLMKQLGKLATLASDHLFIYAGSHIPLERRQLDQLSEFDSPPDVVAPSGPTTAAALQAGILHKYQLLTPALITSLLVAFFVLVPIVFLGISALASIQTTLRSETPKDYSAHDKKVQ